MNDTCNESDNKIFEFTIVGGMLSINGTIVPKKHSTTSKMINTFPFLLTCLRGKQWKNADRLAGFHNDDDDDDADDDDNDGDEDNVSDDDDDDDENKDNDDLFRNG